MPKDKIKVKKGYTDVNANMPVYLRNENLIKSQGRRYPQNFVEKRPEQNVHIPNDAVAEYKKNRYGFRPFGIMSKTDQRMYLFDAQGNLVVNDEAGLGKDKGDHQSVAYVKGKETTPSGHYRLKKTYSAHPITHEPELDHKGYSKDFFMGLEAMEKSGRVLPNPVNPKYTRVTRAIHGYPLATDINTGETVQNWPSDRRAKLNDGLRNNNMSSGCINIDDKTICTPYMQNLNKRVKESNSINPLTEDDFMMYVTPEPKQTGGYEDLLQYHAAQTGFDYNEMINDFHSETPENQFNFLDSIMQAGGKKSAFYTPEAKAKINKLYSTYANKYGKTDKLDERIKSEMDIRFGDKYDASRTFPKEYDNDWLSTIHENLQDLDPDETAETLHTLNNKLVNKEKLSLSDFMKFKPSSLGIIDTYKIVKGFMKNKIVPSTRYTDGYTYQQGGEQDQVMQIIQAFAQLSNQDPQAIAQQIQQAPPEQQQQMLQQMVQVIQQAQSGDEQEAVHNPQEEQMEMQQGGYDHKSLMGYRDNSPYRFNKSNLIKSNKITMNQTGTPLMGVSDTGDMQYMAPYSGDYEFDGDSVMEYPVAQTGEDLKGDIAYKKERLKAIDKLLKNKNLSIAERTDFIKEIKETNAAIKKFEELSTKTVSNPKIETIKQAKKIQAIKVAQAKYQTSLNPKLATKQSIRENFTTTGPPQPKLATAKSLRESFGVAPKQEFSLKNLSDAALKKVAGGSKAMFDKLKALKISSPNISLSDFKKYIPNISGSNLIKIEDSLLSSGKSLINSGKNIINIGSKALPYALVAGTAAGLLNLDDTEIDENYVTPKQKALLGQDPDIVDIMGDYLGFNISRDRTSPESDARKAHYDSLMATQYPQQIEKVQAPVGTTPNEGNVYIKNGLHYKKDANGREVLVSQHPSVKSTGKPGKKIIRSGITPPPVPKPNLVPKFNASMFTPSQDEMDYEPAQGESGFIPATGFPASAMELGPTYSGDIRDMSQGVTDAFARPLPATAQERYTQKFKFQTRNPLDSLANSFALSQAFSPTALPYMQQVNFKAAQTPLIDSRAYIQQINDVFNPIKSNVNANSTTGMAYIASLAGQQADKITETLNDINAKNQQIEAKNNADMVATRNQNFAGQEQARGNYFGEYSQNSAARDNTMNSAMNQLAQTKGQQIAAQNSMNSTLYNSSFLEDETSFLDRLMGNNTIGLDKIEWKKQLDLKAKILADEELKKQIELKASVQAQTGLNRFLKKKLYV